MQNQNINIPNTTISSNGPGPKKAGGPVVSDLKKAADVTGLIPQNVMMQVADKIRESDNILVALSRDPSVDELAAAIGLTLFLDEEQKHTTAIYSGKTPNALQFLQPEGTFETNTDSLQDFIITLSKDKADHLRNKLEGDFVKVYITPYKSKITEGDLEFSYGDFAVDLVLAIGVPSAADLDEALREYGRIMHDATTVNITADQPGRFGEIEWSNQKASSVSEMIAKLIFAMKGQNAVLDRDVATALLTGIVAATNRFSNDKTDPETMELASKLMSMGADQQLIAAHVMDVNTEEPAEAAPSAEMGNPMAVALEAKPTEPYTPFVPVEGTNAEMVPGTETTVPENGVPELPPVEQNPGQFMIPQVQQVNAQAMNSQEVAGTQGAQVGVGQLGEMMQPDTPLPEMLTEQPAVPSMEERRMMEQASSEALGAAVNAALDNAAQAGATGLGMNMSEPAAGLNGQMNLEGNNAFGGVGSQGVNGAELVENQGVILPPPPAPEVGAAPMPPVLPEVQADPGQFHLPGMV